MIDLNLLAAILKEGKLELEPLLTQEEQARLAGFTYPKRHLEWLGGRLAAKAALAKLSAEPFNPLAWQVVNAPDGRPRFLRSDGATAGQSIELSISHSDGLATAVVDHHPLGLDIQKITPAVMRVREKFCTPLEETRLLALNTFSEPVAALTLLWAAKEALRKALGGHPLTGFLAMELTGGEPLGEQALIVQLTTITRTPSFIHRVLTFLHLDYGCAVAVINRDTPWNSSNS